MHPRIKPTYSSILSLPQLDRWYADRPNSAGLEGHMENGTILGDPLLKFTGIGALAIALLWPFQSIAAEKVPMTLATVGVGTPGMTIVDGKIDKDRPGWFTELSRRAASSCGAELTFAFMPWARALEMVKNSDMAGAFNSSYKKDRAVYAVYPMNDGKPDEERASKRYAYYAYVSKGSKDQNLIKNADIKGRRIVVERDVSIIPYLKKSDATIYEVASYETMLRMVAAGDRVDAAVGIEHNIDGAMELYPDVASMVRKIGKPLQKKVGYIMFSKKYYQQHKEMVECFWTTSAQLKTSDWFKTMKSSYN
jgi:polar amino acid transport system substrate-binding protein